MPTAKQRRAFARWLYENGKINEGEADQLPLSLTKIRQSWPESLSQFKPTLRWLHALLMETPPNDLEENTLVFEVGDLAHAARITNYSDVIAAELTRIYDRPVRVTARLPRPETADLVGSA